MHSVGGSSQSILLGRKTEGEDALYVTVAGRDELFVVPRSPLPFLQELTAAKEAAAQPQ